jgi:hypothetical protein
MDKKGKRKGGKYFSEKKGYLSSLMASTMELTQVCSMTVAPHLSDPLFRPIFRHCRYAISNPMVQTKAQNNSPCSICRTAMTETTFGTSGRKS